MRMRMKTKMRKTTMKTTSKDAYQAATLRVYSIGKGIPTVFNNYRAISFKEQKHFSNNTATQDINFSCS